MHRLEPTSDAHRRAVATSYIGEHVLDLAVGAPPEEVTAALPEQYSTPLLEFLLVDPGYVFISWEITPDQIHEASMALGSAGFSRRRLRIRFHDGSPQGEVFQGQELYGETGRWFIALFRPAAEVFAELGFQVGQEFHRLGLAGPLTTPRCEILEPASFDELKVSYGIGQHGRLLLLGIDRAHDANWPQVWLPEPEREEYQTQPSIVPGSADQFSAGMPGALGQPSGGLGSGGVSSFSAPAVTGRKNDD